MLERSIKHFKSDLTEETLVLRSSTGTHESKVQGAGKIDLGVGVEDEAGGLLEVSLPDDQQRD